MKASKKNRPNPTKMPVFVYMKFHRRNGENNFTLGKYMKQFLICIALGQKKKVMDSLIWWSNKTESYQQQLVSFRIITL